jgi:hypothetical protein
MNNKKIEKFMSMLLGFSSSLTVIGAIFRLQHWQYGYQILWIGFISFFILSSYEIKRLKKIIKLQEENLHD